MRRKEFNIVNKEIVKSILDECEYGTLGLISHNKPYSVAVNFVYFEEKIYFHGAGKGRKIDLIKENNNASFLVVKPYSIIPSYFSNTLAACPATQFFSSVLIEGEIRFVEDVDKKSKILNALMEKLQSEGGYEKISYEKPMYKKMLENTTVLELNPKDISCKVKVGQNLSDKKRKNMEEKLSQRNTILDKKTLEIMSNINE